MSPPPGPEVDRRQAVDDVMVARPGDCGRVAAASVVEPDAEQVEAQRARTLLELAGVHVRQALRVPEDLDDLRTVVAEALLENAMLRLDVHRLAERVDALEQRAGGDR